MLLTSRSRGRAVAESDGRDTSEQVAPGDGHGGPDVGGELKVVRRTYTRCTVRREYGTVPPGQPKLGLRCSGMTATSAPA